MEEEQGMITLCEEEQGMITLYVDELSSVCQGDAKNWMSYFDPDGSYVVITDPPYNIGKRYGEVSDDRSWSEYRELMLGSLESRFVVLAYPEIVYRITDSYGFNPTRTAAWVYRSNTPRNMRLACWYGLNADPGAMKQPFKNPKDKRIAKKIAEGKQARGYEWREVNQVKNVSKGKTAHPAQNPVEVMEWLIRATAAKNKKFIVVDPFMGSGTTLVAAKKLGIPSIGIDLNRKYCNIAIKRLEDTEAGTNGYW